MTWICPEWDPRNDVETCNRFIRDFTVTRAVDRDDETLDTVNPDGEAGDNIDCGTHGTRAEEPTWHQAIAIYQDIAWNNHYGFCDDCMYATSMHATHALAAWECPSCGDLHYPFGEADIEDEVDIRPQETLTEWMPRPQPTPRISRTHALATLT